MYIDGVDRILAADGFDPDHISSQENKDADDGETSVLPWVQITILGTVVAGLNVLFSQMILGLAKPDARNLQASYIDYVSSALKSSLETFENKIGLPEEKCQEEMVCEIRQLASRIPRVEALIQDYGLSMAGTRFQRALHVGGSGRNCANVIRSNRSTNSSTNSSSNSNSNSSNSSNSTLGLGNSSRDNSNSKSARCSSTLQTLVHIAKTYYGYA